MYRRPRLQHNRYSYTVTNLCSCETAGGLGAAGAGSPAPFCGRDGPTDGPLNSDKNEVPVVVAAPVVVPDVALAGCPVRGRMIRRPVPRSVWLVLLHLILVALLPDRQGWFVFLPACVRSSGRPASILSPDAGVVPSSGASLAVSLQFFSLILPYMALFCSMSCTGYSQSGQSGQYSRIGHCSGRSSASNLLFLCHSSQNAHTFLFFGRPSPSISGSWGKR